MPPFCEQITANYPVWSHRQEHANMFRQWRESLENVYMSGLKSKNVGSMFRHVHDMLLLSQHFHERHAHFARLRRRRIFPTTRSARSSSRPDMQRRRSPAARLATQTARAPPPSSVFRMASRSAPTTVLRLSPCAASPPPLSHVLGDSLIPPA